MANLPLVVLIGDSIRMGYQDHVASQLAGRAEVWVPEEQRKGSLWITHVGGLSS